MFIDVEVNYYKVNRVVSVDASTLRVEVQRLQSDPNFIVYQLVGTTNQGRLLIRSSKDVSEMLDLYDSYMDLAEHKRKASGEQFSFADLLGGENSAG